MRRISILIASLCFLVLALLLAGCSSSLEGLSGDSDKGGNTGAEKPYEKVLDKAESASCKANQLSMKSSIAAYHAENSEYPASLQDLVDSGYLEKIPLCPASATSNKPYSYDPSTGKVTCPNGHPAP